MPTTAVALTAVVLTGLFATGISRTPHGPVETVVYDLLLYNAVPVLAAALSLRAARAVPAERVAWWAAALAWSSTAVGNVVHTLGVAASTRAAFPSYADAWWLAAFPAFYVLALGLLRSRLPGLTAGTWLDGLIGALAVTAVAATWFLVPSTPPAGFSTVEAVANYAYPVADLLLLALLGAVLATLGLRVDRVVATVCAALVLKFVADLLMADALAGEGYVPGGASDLACVGTAALTCLAAAGAVRGGRHRPERARGTSRTGWQVVAVLLACNVASLFVLRMEWGDAEVGAGELFALGCLAASFVRTVVTLAEVRSLHDVHRQAATDELTDLPNRRELLRRAGEQLRRGRPTSLLLLDLDGFKAVNDGLGHRAGDDLLRMLGDRIRPALRPGDVVARLGGDEFAVLLPDTAGREALECAARVHDLICRPATVDGVAVRIGASIGVSTAPEQATTVAELLHHADRAMYAAKAARGGVRRFDPELERSGRRGRTAAAPSPPAGELLFRPVADAAGRIVAAEALVAPAGGSVRPAGVDTLPGLLAAVGGWWGEDQVPAEITLSPTDLASGRPADRISAALLRAGLPPDAVVCRLPSDPGPAAERAADVLSALRARGVRTAVDGFGSGLLALARLRDLPADLVHLDPGLTRDVLADPRAAAVVQHTAALARALGGVVVADGADAATTAALTDLGCLVLLRSDAAPYLSPTGFAQWLRRAGRTQDPVGR